MAATLTGIIKMFCSITEILDNTPFASTANKQVIHDQLNLDTTPETEGVPVTVVAAFNQALTAGAATIDFTALLGTNGATVSGSGLKLQYVLVKAKSTNANALTVKNGTSNGYGGWGADFAVTLDASQQFMVTGRDLEPDVDGTHKTWTLAGTGTQSIDIILVFG